MSDPIELEDVKRLNLSPSDVLLVTVRADTTAEELDQIRAAFWRLLPDVRVVCVTPDVDVRVVSPTVDDMAGAFEGGPDSVEWLREQRGRKP